MPFDKLPGGNINTAPYANLRWPIYPPRPVFPTYEVTMNALNSILPALDPVERAKRQEALMQLQIAKASLPVELQKAEFEKNLLDVRKSAIDEYNRTGKMPSDTTINPWTGVPYTPEQLNALQKLKSTKHGTENLINAVPKDTGELPVEKTSGPGFVPDNPPNPLRDIDKPLGSTDVSKLFQQTLGTKVPGYGEEDEDETYG